MSTNCPPQLQLSIQPSTTSFKRSFEQFGFDLDSPVITGPEDLVAETTDLDTAAMDGNVEGRSPGIGIQQQNASRRGNKRPRSASSFSSESSSSASASSGRSGLRSEASTSSSASSTSSPPGVHHPSSIRPQNRTRIQLLSPSPPRLPTPEIQDIEMPTEYSPTRESVIGDHHQHHSNSVLLPIPIPTTTHAAHASSTSFVPHVHHPHSHPASSSSPPPQQQPTTEDMFRLSLERFNAFDTEISALRQADNSASLSLSLGLGLMPTSNTAGGIRATTTRLISPTPLSVDRRRSRTPPPTLPLLPIQVAAEGEDESAMILPEVLPTAPMTPAPVATVPISASAASSSSSPISPSHTNRGTASTAASHNTTTNALDFHVSTSPFSDHFFMQEEGLRTNTLIPTEEEEEEESFEDDGTSLHPLPLCLLVFSCSCSFPLRFTSVKAPCFFITFIPPSDLNKRLPTLPFPFLTFFDRCCVNNNNSAIIIPISRTPSRPPSRAPPFSDAVPRSSRYGPGSLEVEIATCTWYRRWRLDLVRGFRRA